MTVRMPSEVISEVTESGSTPLGIITRRRNLLTVLKVALSLHTKALRLINTKTVKTDDTYSREMNPWSSVRSACLPEKFAVHIITRQY